MQSPTPSLLKRALRRTGILLTTAATGALAIGLVAVGSNVLASRAVSIEVAEAAPPVPVRTTRVEMRESYSVTRAYLGQVEPHQQIALGFEPGGTLREVLVDEGDRVERGQVLARLDTRTLAAERAAQVAARDALVAQADLAALTAGRQQALEQKGWAATQAADQARLTLAALQAQIAQAEAGIAGIDVALDKMVIRAPFAATVAARAADPGATLAPGAPVVQLLERGGVQMRVGLPPEMAATLPKGSTVTVDVEGRQLAATVSGLRPDLQASTRTQTILLDLQVEDGTPAPFGQTGTLTLTTQVPLTGTWVPLAALREGKRGLWTLLTYEQDGTVGLAAVEILHAEAERAFVRGTLEDGAQIISSGAHRVLPGQAVALAAE